jgi:hypothetical protein
MTRPSSRSRRPNRGKPSSKMLVHDAGLEALRADYPEAVKTRVYLACRGALHGARRCLVCGGPGLTTRVFIPSEALRVDRPDFRAIAAYWLCLQHRELQSEDPQVIAALAKKGVRR